MQKINIKKKFQQDRRKLTEMEQMNTESEDEPLKFDPILRVKFKKKKRIKVKVEHFSSDKVGGHSRGLSSPRVSARYFHQNINFTQ